jgi:ribosomal protein S8E
MKAKNAKQPTAQLKLHTRSLYRFRYLHPNQPPLKTKLTMKNILKKGSIVTLKTGKKAKIIEAGKVFISCLKESKNGKFPKRTAFITIQDIDASIPFE